MTWILTHDDAQAEMKAWEGADGSWRLSADDALLAGPNRRFKTETGLLSFIARLLENLRSRGWALESGLDLTLAPQAEASTRCYGSHYRS